jgi:hypothetical protein
MPRNEPPGELCDACHVAIDAHEDVVQHGERFYCAETCRRDSVIGEAEQMDLGGRGE